MADGGRISFEEKLATGSFLLSKSDFQAKKAQGGLDNFILTAFLKKTFPETTFEEPFVEYALRRLGDARSFGVLMIRLDPIKEGEADPASDREGQVRDLVEILRPFCKDGDSGWGSYESDILCSFFPGKTDLDCMEMGSAVQEQLSRRRRETVSMGCARYPMINFSKAQVFENARKAIDHAAFFGPGSRVAFDAVSLNISGDNRYQEGDMPGAIREYQAALKIEPTNVNVLNSLGVCYAVTGDLNRAVECFETVLWIDPGEVMTLYNLALADQAGGDIERALKRYQEVLDIQKDHFETLFQMGRLYVEQEKPGDGKPYLKKAVSLRPASGPANRYLGECCMGMGRIDEAIQTFKKAIKINPNDAASLSALGYLFNEVGENPEVALTFCEQSVKIAPEDGLFRYRLGMLYYHQDRIQDAEKALSEALRLGYDATALLNKIQEARQESPQ